MVDWLTANLRDRADYDAICRAERGEAVITADHEVARTISNGIVDASLELLRAGIEAGIVDSPADREKILTRIVVRVTDAAVEMLGGLSAAQAA